MTNRDDTLLPPPINGTLTTLDSLTGKHSWDLWSKVARIEQQMGPLETPAAGSQINLELLSIPKQTMVGIFVNAQLTFADKHHERDTCYKVALVLMSTAEETNYHNTPNKPAAMIMVRLSLFAWPFW